MENNELVTFNEEDAMTASIANEMIDGEKPSLIEMAKSHPIATGVAVGIATGGVAAAGYAVKRWVAPAIKRAVRKQAHKIVDKEAAEMAAENDKIAAEAIQAATESLAERESVEVPQEPKAE